MAAGVIRQTVAFGAVLVAMQAAAFYGLAQIVGSDLGSITYLIGAPAVIWATSSVQWIAWRKGERWMRGHMRALRRMKARIEGRTTPASVLQGRQLVFTLDKTRHTKGPLVPAPIRVRARR